MLDLEIRYQVLDLLGLLLGHQISSVRSYRDQDIKLKAARGSWEALGGPFRGLLGAFGGSRGTLVGALGGSWRGFLGALGLRGARVDFFDFLSFFSLKIPIFHSEKKKASETAAE